MAAGCISAAFFVSATGVVIGGNKDSRAATRQSRVVGHGCAMPAGSLPFH